MSPHKAESSRRVTRAASKLFTDSDVDPTANASTVIPLNHLPVVLPVTPDLPEDIPNTLPDIPDPPELLPVTVAEVPVPQLSPSSSCLSNSDSDFFDAYTQSASVKMSSNSNNQAISVYT